MIVTITTDASFNNQHQVGGYAFWITCDEGRYRKAGILKAAENLSQSQFKSILNALHQLSILPLSKITRIIINTDSPVVLNIIKRKKIIQKIWAGEVYENYTDLITEFGFKNISFRPVTGEGGKRVKRNWVNNWCHTEAKKIVRARVEQLEIPAKK